MKNSSSESGQTLALFVVLISALVAVLLLVVDYGIGVSVKSKQQSTVDAAALAGANLLPSDPGGAVAEAIDYASRNGIPASQVTVSFPVDPPTQIKVTVQQTTSNLFSNFFGVAAPTASASAVAIKGPPDSMNNAVSVAIDQSLYQYNEEVSFQADQNVNQTLCKSTGDCPAFANVILGQPGLNYFRDVMNNGYPGLVNTGDVLQQNGNNGKTVLDAMQNRISLAPNETYTSFEKGSPRLLFVPITTLVTDKGQGTYKVVGFGAFFIESVTRAGTTQGLITGRFVNYLVSSGTGRITKPWKNNNSAPATTDFNVQVVQLIQ